MNQPSYQKQSRDLVDGLKSVCASHGLGNDGNEYKIIVQTFLYKLLCDKFAWEMKRQEPKLAKAPDWIAAWQALPKNDREMLELNLGGDVPRLTASQLIPSLFNKLNEPGFADRFDDTLIEIASANHDIFAVRTEDNQKVALFDRLSRYVTSSDAKRDAFYLRRTCCAPTTCRQKSGAILRKTMTNKTANSPPSATGSSRC